jgi:hypothetical protein
MKTNKTEKLIEKIKTYLDNENTLSELGSEFNHVTEKLRLIISQNGELIQQQQILWNQAYLEDYKKSIRLSNDKILAINADIMAELTDYLCVVSEKITKLTNINKLLAADLPDDYMQIYHNHA